MESIELNKIEKQVNKLEFNQDPLSNLIKRIDEIYIWLDEKNHINLYNERLNTIKSNLATAIQNEKDAYKRREIFAASKDEVLDLLNEISRSH